MNKQMNKQTNEITFYSTFNIFELKKYWNEIIDPHSGKYYLTYEYNRYCFLMMIVQILISIIIKHTKNYTIRFIIGRQGKNVNVIFPCVIYFKEKRICWLASECSSGSGYNDIICNDMNNEKWKVFCAYIAKKFPSYKLDLHDISEDSMIPDIVKERDCVRINLKKEESSVDFYTPWYSSLSKSSRQNLRTAYNRIEKERLSYRIAIAAKIGIKEKYQLFLLYKKRNSQINNYNLNFSKKEKIMSFIEMFFSIHFLLVNKSDRTKIIWLEIDGNKSAFMILHNENDGVVVPKLAIDTDFGKYSPGCIMIAEYIKSLSINGVENFCFDLSRGSEQYKISLRGEKYNNYCYKG